MSGFNMIFGGLFRVVGTKVAKAVATFLWLYLRMLALALR